MRTRFTSGSILGGEPAALHSFPTEFHRHQPRGSASSRKPVNPKNVREAIPYLVRVMVRLIPKKFPLGLFEIRARGNDPKYFVGANSTEAVACRANADPKNISGPILPDWSLSVQYCQTQKISTDVNAAQRNRRAQRGDTGIRR
jgi:hypothetical protein